MKELIEIFARFIKDNESTILQHRQECICMSCDKARKTVALANAYVEDNTHRLPVMKFTISKGFS